MKPVLVLQHLVSDGTSFLGTWLAEQGVAMDVRCTEAGDVFPHDLAAHGALAILGGSMGANDPLPSLRQAEALVRSALALQMPTIGHCLGGQLIARALGAPIRPSPRPEVGWFALDWAPEAITWFGEPVAMTAAPEVFQWHFDAFALPPGAVPLARTAACPHQAFALGNCLAMQFHVELDASKLETWLTTTDPDYELALRQDPDQVQTATQMRLDAERRLAAQQGLAAFAYTRWLGSAAGR